MISFYQTNELVQGLRERGDDPLAVDRMRALILRKYCSREEALRGFESSVAEFFGAHCRFHSLAFERRLDSALDGSSKLIFVTPPGDAVETVILRIASGRTTLCISSQAGCAAACVFCATGRIGRVRSLAVDEILDQVVQANQILKGEQRRLRNLVFMGMGEPFHNEQNVAAALEQLTAPKGFNIDERRILVSTVGIPDAMVRFARRFRRMGLALSLHSAEQAVREQLVPMARRFNLETLRSALDEVSRLQDREVMIEYLLLAGINDRPKDVDALAEYLNDLPVHINLIPYNAIVEAPELQGSDAATRLEFATGLKSRGYKVTTRYSLGSDIAAACGQLAISRT